MEQSSRYAARRAAGPQRLSALAHRAVALLLAASTLLPLGLQAEPVRRDHINVELVAAMDAAVPGEPLTVALRLEPDDHWHTYWRNPGDSGLPTRMSWTLPEGLQAGDILWPFPERQPLGPLTNFGYSGEHFLLTEIDIPDTLEASTLPLVVAASWLVCDDVCIPGSADLTLELPVRDAAQPSQWATALAATRKHIATPLVVPAQYAVDGDRLRIQLQPDALGDTANAVYFPATPELASNTDEPVFQRTDDVLEISVGTSEYLGEPPTQTEHVVVLDDERAVRFQAQLIGPEALVPVEAASAPGGSGFSLWLAIPFALLGGLILNLMPCVFPVLSIKAVSVAQQSGSKAAHGRAHALFYTGGVVGGFVLLAIGLLVLREAGERIGWGFQLQSPVFVAILAWVMFILGLSLAGAFEVGTRLMGIGDSLTHQGGNRGALITGLLACLVATPCTAPFMGPAMGFAITQPAVIALTVFAALGLGMALPFLLIGFVPAAARLLPRPGAWMLTFKQLMAFPMYLTAVWLIWVLGRQTGVNGMAIGLTGIVLLAFAVWLWGRRPVSGPQRVVLAAMAWAAVLLAGVLLASPLLRSAPAQAVETTSAHGGDWGDYAPDRVAALQANGQAVFVNLTADWCVTCHVNERVALNTGEVIAAMERAGVTRLKGDWTNRDPVITTVLERHDRTGVPLYLLYPGTAGAAPQVLPQLLTPQRVIAAIDAL
ncbi:MAG: hypothetical protein CMP06_07540 [Xanthomonadales bacterium]|nr:hypothetical protein [Xanthomonadales bacterium]